MARNGFSTTHGSGGSPETAVLSELGRNLRSVYAGLMSEPVPEHLAYILRQFDDPPGEMEGRGADERAAEPPQT